MPETIAHIPFKIKIFDLDIQSNQPQIDTSCRSQRLQNNENQTFKMVLLIISCAGFEQIFQFILQLPRTHSRELPRHMNLQE